MLVMPEETERTTENLRRAETRTGHLLNIGLQRCHYTKLLNRSSQNVFRRGFPHSHFSEKLFVGRTSFGVTAQKEMKVTP